MTPSAHLVVRVVKEVRLLIWSFVSQNDQKTEQGRRNERSW